MLACHIHFFLNCSKQSLFFFCSECIFIPEIIGNLFVFFPLWLYLTSLLLFFASCLLLEAKTFIQNCGITLIIGKNNTWGWQSFFFDQFLGNKESVCSQCLNPLSECKFNLMKGGYECLCRDGLVGDGQICEKKIGKNYSLEL